MLGQLVLSTESGPCTSSSVVDYNSIRFNTRRNLFQQSDPSTVPFKKAYLDVAFYECDNTNIESEMYDESSNSPIA